MPPAEISKFITGCETFVGFFALLYVVSWQVRIWPRDRQMWSAMGFIVATTAIVGQLCISYLGGPALGTGLRGNIFWALWICSVAWFAWCTRQHNKPIHDRMKEIKRQGLPPETHADVRVLVGRREEVVGRRETVATRREQVVTEREDHIDQAT